MTKYICDQCDKNIPDLPSKYTKEQIERAKSLKGTKSYKEIAEELNIPHSALYKMWNGEIVEKARARRGDIHFCSRYCWHLHSRNSLDGWAKTAKRRVAYRAKGKGWKSEVTKDILMCMWEDQQGLCSITGIPMSFMMGDGAPNPYIASVDRIDSSLGYTLDNIHLVCYQVNMMKSNLSVDELKAWCHKIIGRR
jgi:hypothetical protein